MGTYFKRDKFNTTLLLWKIALLVLKREMCRLWVTIIGKHCRVLLGMRLEEAGVGAWGSVPLRGRLGLLSSRSAPLIKRDLNEDSWLRRGGQPGWVKEEASANKPGMGPYTENEHNWLPLLFLRGLLYGIEGPGGLVRAVPFEGALEKEPDGKIKLSWDQCDAASTAPWSHGSVILDESVFVPLWSHAMLLWCECLERAHTNAKCLDWCKALFHYTHKGTSIS